MIQSKITKVEYKQLIGNTICHNCGYTIPFYKYGYVVTINDEWETIACDKGCLQDFEDYFNK